MNKHPHNTADQRRLVLFSIYASLCSILVLQLAIRSATTPIVFSANTTEVSALIGDYGTTVEDLRSFQRSGRIAARRTLRLHTAPNRQGEIRGHQVRFGR